MAEGGHFFLVETFQHFSRSGMSYHGTDSEWKYVRLSLELDTYYWWSIGRRVPFAWFEAGMPFIQQFRGSWVEKEQQIFLLIAKYCQSKYKLSSFMNASHKLRGNKKFMRKVIEIDPILFSCCAIVANGSWSS